MTIQKRMAIMSHLSDVQEVFNIIGMSQNNVGKDAIRTINFVKKLILDARPMRKEMTEQELDQIWEECK